MFRSSRLRLPKLDEPPRTILEYLCAHFPHVSPDAWRSRVDKGLITLSGGGVLREDSPYRHGITVFYRRSVPSEPLPRENVTILYRDDEILVVDKPAGTLVTPSGNHVERSLIVQLEKMTGLPDLTPLHRLDRDTAGVLLFGIRPASRQHYHRLFADHAIEREYMALAEVRGLPAGSKWRIENRLEAGEPWFRQRIAPGPSNAITNIELIDVSSGIGRFRLLPETGRKHQLRVHMMSIGCPIIGDPFYPTIRKKDESEPALQLLASRLAFVDPISGESRSFTSGVMLNALANYSIPRSGE